MRLDMLYPPAAVVLAFLLVNGYQLVFEQAEQRALRRVLNRYLSPAVALVQEQVPPHARVLAGALLLLVMNLIGLGFGPTFLGAASDYFRATHPEHSLQLAFYTLVPFYVLAVLCFLWLARALPRHDPRGGRS